MGSLQLTMQLVDRKAQTAPPPQQCLGGGGKGLETGQSVNASSRPWALQGGRLLHPGLSPSLPQLNAGNSHEEGETEKTGKDPHISFSKCLGMKRGHII